MATTILLLIIYSAFISLGLPDALLGVAWPIIRGDFDLALDAAGIISIVVTVGTIASSLLSGKLIKRFGEGKITLISGLMTGLALLGNGLAPSYAWFIVLALPLGFGAGSVDTALNHYVALHFKAHHMNWLHSFWGLGATAGPVLMAAIMGNSGSWRGGYLTVAGIQLALAFIILISLPLWGLHAKTHPLNAPSETETAPAGPKQNVLRRKGVPFALLIFLFYCAGEYAMGLWGASYLVETGKMTLENAARSVAIYYGGITAGRILSGFISFKLDNRSLIRLGIGIAFLGAVLLIFSKSALIATAAFMLIGLGFAPVFPGMVHETPKRFGAEAAQSIIGFQMTAAYVGIAVFPPLLGIVLDKTGTGIFPAFIVFCVTMLYMLQRRLNQLT